MDVIIDSIDGDIATGRTYADAPEIDGVVTFSGAAGMKVGEFSAVEITGSDDYDLTGIAVEDEQ